MRISRFRAISIFVFCALAALLTTLLASTASAQSRNAPASPPAAGESAKPALSPMEQVASLQARMWRDFFGRKYDDAIVLSDDIVQMLSSLQRQPNANKAALERARLEAGHCLARAHWAQGTPASREQAKKLWAAIGKNTEISSNVQRQSIADALQAQADGKADVALKLLEGVVKRNLPDTCTAEAAIELSRLYAAAQRFGDAEKMLKAVAAFMDKCGKNGEITAASLDPFAAALKSSTRRLRYDEDAGRLEFERAEKLRKDEKYAEAVAAYRDIITRLPDCDYAAPSDLHIGTCLKAAGEQQRAIDHWLKFINAGPAGPWRGQAYVALIRLYLEEQFDLDEAAKYAALADGQLPVALRNDAAAESWKAAAYDINLLSGTVAYIQGRTPAAVAKFEAALKVASGKAATEGLPELIAAAKANRPLLPEEVGGISAAGDGRVDASVNKRVALILSLGTIYNLGGRFTAAGDLFQRVTGTALLAPPAAATGTGGGTGGRPTSTASGPGGATGSGAAKPALTPPMPGASIAQVSYAAYGLGVSIEGQGSRAGDGQAAARTAYEASLKRFATGTWHDETLFRLATLIQLEADKKHAPSAPATADASGKPGADRTASAKPLTKDDLDKQAAAEKVRQTTLAKARAEALPYWEQLVRRYPQSQYVETAAFSIGLIHHRLQDWPQLVKTFEGFVKTYAGSALAGDAMWILARCHFEELLEPVGAKKHFEQLDTWIKTARAAKSTPPTGWETLGHHRQPTAREQASGSSDGLGKRRVVLSGAIPVKREPGEKPESFTGDRYFDELESDAAKCLGFIAFVDDMKDEAAAYYTRTEALDRKLGWVQDPRFSDCSRLRWGLENGYLYAYPQELAPYQGRQRFAVLLADYFYVTQRFEQAEETAQKVLDGQAGGTTSISRIYPHYLKATCIYWTQGREAAFAEYAALLVLLRGIEGAVPATADRAAFAAGNVAHASSDPAVYMAGRELLRKLALSKRENEFVYKGRIGYALVLSNEGRHEEAVQLLSAFTDASGEYKRIAETYMDILSRTAQRTDRKGETR